MTEKRPLPYRWPPRIIFNTDGCLVFKYLKRRNPDDVTAMFAPLAETSVDVVSVLVGINDDLCWHGSSHGELWGEHMGTPIQSLFPGDDSTRTSSIAMNMVLSDLLQMNLAAMVDDGHDIFQLYVERARQTGLGIYASFRMNDAHCNMEHCMADARRSALIWKLHGSGRVMILRTISLVLVLTALAAPVLGQAGPSAAAQTNTTDVYETQIIDTATYDDPCQFPLEIPFVLAGHAVP